MFEIESPIFFTAPNNPVSALLGSLTLNAAAAAAAPTPAATPADRKSARENIIVQR